MARPTGPKVFLGTPLTNAVPLLIGHTGFFGASQYFKGLIDEVEIFNRALLPSEILAIFDAGTEGKCKVRTVGIDIKPGSFPNSINLKGKGVIPVAILSTTTFDVLQ